MSYMVLRHTQTYTEFTLATCIWLKMNSSNSSPLYKIPAIQLQTLKGLKGTVKCDAYDPTLKCDF